MIFFPPVLSIMFVAFICVLFIHYQTVPLQGGIWGPVGEAAPVVLAAVVGLMTEHKAGTPPLASRAFKTFLLSLRFSFALPFFKALGSYKDFFFFFLLPGYW